MKKILAFLLCFACTFGCLSLTASADFDTPEDEIVVSEYNNVSAVNAEFSITNGLAEVEIAYYGYNGITQGATITTKIQKRFLLVFWTDVDIGMPNNEWVDQPTGTNYANSHSTLLSATGTYKAVVSFTIYGSGGEPDVKTFEIQETYN